MITYNNIVVGVNFTESSARAVLQAQYLAQQEGAELHVVHSLDVRGLDDLRKHHEIDTSAMVRNAQKNLDSYTVQILGDDQSVTCCVLEGDPHRALVSYADKLGADLLVLGSNEYEEDHSKNGIFSIKCIREAKLPVLLVKDMEGNAFQKVIVYADLAEISPTLIAHAAKQSLHADGHLDVVHFTRPPWMVASHVHYSFGAFEEGDFKAQYKRLVRDQLQSTIRDATEYLPITINPIVIESGNCAYSMIEYLGESDAGLVVIGKTGKGGNNNNALGTTAELIVRKAGCPVLVIPQTVVNNSVNR